MKNENFNNSIILFFFGILIIYLLYKPPSVIFKYSKIDTMKNVNYLDTNDIFSHNDFCKN